MKLRTGVMKKALVLVGFAALGLKALWPSTGHAVPEGVYEIVNVNSGKCLDVVGQNPNDGATLSQWDCWGGANQRWRVSYSDGYAHLSSVQTGKELWIRDRWSMLMGLIPMYGAFGSFAALMSGGDPSWPSIGQTATLWAASHDYTFKPSGRGMAIEVRRANNNLHPAIPRIGGENFYIPSWEQNLTVCLDVSGQSTWNGAVVQGWDCWGGANQQWEFRPVN